MHDPGESGPLARSGLLPLTPADAAPAAATPPARPSVPGISATPFEDNLRYFNVVIAGPADSPFEGTALVAGRAHSPARPSATLLEPVARAAGPRRELQAGALPHG